MKFFIAFMLIGLCTLTDLFGGVLSTYTVKKGSTFSITGDASTCLGGFGACYVCTNQPVQSYRQYYFKDGATLYRPSLSFTSTAVYTKTFNTAGTFTIDYYYQLVDHMWEGGPCNDDYAPVAPTKVFTITIYVEDDLIFNSFDAGTLCSNGATINLLTYTNKQSGASLPVVFKVNGTPLAGSTFNPASYTVGATLNVTAEYAFSTGTSIKANTAKVNAAPTLTVTDFTSYCADQGSFVISGTDRVVYSGGTLNITSVPSNAVLYSAPNFLFNPSFASGSQSASVTFTITSAQGCTASQVKSATVGQGYTLTKNTDYSLCEGSTVNVGVTTPPTVTVGTTGTGSWSMITSCTGCLTGSTFMPPDIPAASAISHTVRYSYVGTGGYLGCNKSVDKTIVVNPKADLTTANSSVQECATGAISLTSKFVPKANNVNIIPNTWVVPGAWTGSIYTAANQTVNAGNIVIAGSQQTFALQFTHINGFGCTTTSSNVNLVLDKVPNAPTNTTAVTTLCGSGSFNLSVSGASGSDTYVWRNDVGTIIGSGSTYSTGNLTPGSYTYTAAIKNANGCESNRTTLTATVNANPTVTSVVSSLTKCTGSYTANLYNDYNITAGGSGTNNWSSSNSAVNAKLNATSGILDLTGLSVGSNIPITYKFTATSGCFSTLALTLNISSGATTPAVDDVKRCEVGAVTLQVKNVDPSATYNWYTAASGGSLIGAGVAFTTNSLSAPLNGSQTYSYFVEASTSNCTSVRDQAVVTIVNTSAVNAGPDVAFCDNTVKINDLRLDASPSGGTFTGPGITYSGVTPIFNCGGSCGIGLLANNENYTLTYTYTNTGCTYTDERVITLGFKPIVTATPETSISPQAVAVGEYVTFEHNMSDATETSWTFVGESAGAIGNPVGYIFYTPGFKDVQFTMKRLGCAGTFTFTANDVVFVEDPGFELITEAEDPIGTLRNAQVYPNPLNGALHIDLPAAFPNVQVAVTTVNGQTILVKSDSLQSGKNQLFDEAQINTLPRGFYILRVSVGTFEHSYKMIKL